MRLLHPDPGELADRQSILNLKMKYASMAVDEAVTSETLDGTRFARTTMKNATKINIQPFHSEHEAIQKYLETNWFPNIAAFTERQDKYDATFAQLTEVNEQLWKLEDQARVLRSAPDKHQDEVVQRKAEVLDLITELNDKRAEFVKQINMIWNINTQEKLHQ